MSEKVASSHPPEDTERQDRLDEIFGRLSPSSVAALARAEGMRVAHGLDKLHMEHLLAGLHDQPDGQAGRALGAAGIGAERLYEILAGATDLRFPVEADVPELPGTPPLSSHAAEALLAAGDLALELRKPDEQAPPAIRTQELLLGAMAIRRCTVIEALHEAGFNPTRVLLEESRDPAAAKPVSIAMDSDAPITRLEQDKFNYGEYARALFGLINEDETDTPLTLAINARWGVGKTSLANLVRVLLEGYRLGGRPPHVVCWFNAWLHDEANHLAPGYVAAVAQAADENRRWWQRALDPLPIQLVPRPDRLRRRVFRFLALGLGVAALSMGLLWIAYQTGYGLTTSEQVSGTVGYWSWLGQRARDLSGSVALFLPPDMVESAAVGGGIWVTFGMLLVKLRDLVFGATRAVAMFVTDPTRAAERGSLKRVREQLGKLIGEACRGGDRRFVIFVDDLERCRPPRGVDLLEATNQLLNHPNVVTIVMADMPAVAANVQMKYGELAKQYNPASIGGATEAGALAYGRYYLQKMIQLQFDLPEPQRRAREMLTARSAVAPTEADDRGVAIRPSARALLRETATRLFDFGWDSATAISRPVREGIRRWDPHGIGTRPIVLLFWVLSLPALLLGGTVLAAVRERRGRRRELPQAAWAGSFALASGLWLLMGIFLVSFGESIGLPPSVRSWSHVASIYGALVVLPAILLGWGESRRRWRSWRDARRRTEELEGSESLDLAREESGDDEISTALIYQLELRRLADESVLLKRAFEPAREHLPPIPRHLKRFKNRLRLLLFIAHERRMLDRDGERVATLLGKWAVLQEVWPELAQHLTSSPTDFASIENPEERVKALKAIAPQYATDRRLAEFLDGQPKLARIIDKLVTFQPLELAT